MNSNIYIVSDLHLEFSYFRPPSVSDQADVIILAGDIDIFNKGVFWARERWPDKPVIYIAGNHEFYGYQRADVLDALRIAAKETGVHFLDDDEIVIHGVRFLGATLWMDFHLYGYEMQSECMIVGQRALNDFALIREGDRRFSPSDALRLNQESIKWLELNLKNEYIGGPTVVVTHHAPSKESVVPRYQKDLVSACFASRLEHLLGYNELWVHGHMHDSLDYQFNGTRVICNPRGYSRFEKACENARFNPGLMVEVGKGFAEVRKG